MKIFHVRFEVLRAVVMKSSIFSSRTQRRTVRRYIQEDRALKEIKIQVRVLRLQALGYSIKFARKNSILSTVYIETKTTSPNILFLIKFLLKTTVLNFLINIWNILTKKARFHVIG
jgi:hypothetical protein